MQFRPRWNGTWMIVAALVAIPIAFVLGTSLWIHRIAARRWAAMEDLVQSWIAEAKSREDTRHVLEGDPLPGNAWDDYELALKDIDDGLAWMYLRDFLRGDHRNGGAWSRKMVEGYVADHGSSLEHWTNGLRRANNRPSRDWESLQIDDMRKAFALAHLVACKARFLSEEGHLFEAAELLLGVGLFAHDVGYNGYEYQGWGSELFALSINGIRDLLLSGRLAKSDLERIESGLEKVDRSFNRQGLSFLNERIRVGLAFLRVGPEAALAPLCFAKATWRFGFSSKLMAADAFERITRWYTRFAGAESMSWREVLVIRGETERELAECPNRMFAAPESHNLWWWGTSMRRRLAQFRLLRMAAHFLAKGEILSLDDPFGTKLLHSISGGRLKAWSVSMNGIDDSGKGEWEMRGWGPRIPDDIVLEVGP